MTQAQTIRMGCGRTRVLLIHGSGSAAKPFSRLGERLVAEVTDSHAVPVKLAGYGREASDPHLSRIEQHLYVLERDLLVRHTPRILEGAEQLCTILDKVRKEGLQSQ